MMLKVSIVIVCMNNLKDLYPCLDSIKKYTFVSYETFVVAYLFSKDNLEKVKADYPWVTFIESNEIRGFSENNNIALRKAKGKYCFVLNDDTEMKMPVIDSLYEDIENSNQNVAVVSPKTVFRDGRLQSCGRPKISCFDYIKSNFGLWKESNVKSKYTNGKGVFLSYTLVGAAFLIRRDIFKEVGFFDERFFFCPEDIALGNILNDKGYMCMVDSEVVLCHYEGQTAKKTMMATNPSGMKGSLLYYSKGSKFRLILLSFVLLLSNILKIVFHYMKSIKGNEKHYILYKSYVNCLKAIFMNKSPKEIFIKFYHNLI
jgi:GT2 family glycosyltransferase